MEWLCRGAGRGFSPDNAHDAIELRLKPPRSSSPAGRVARPPIVSLPFLSLAGEKFRALGLCLSPVDMPRCVDVTSAATSCFSGSGGVRYGAGEVDDGVYPVDDLFVCVLACGSSCRCQTQLLGLYGKLFGREQNTPETERERDM
jgi:hypothetical protein